MRTWDEKVVLISANGYGEDEIGQQIPIEAEQENLVIVKKKFPEMNSTCRTEQYGNFRKI